MRLKIGLSLVLVVALGTAAVLLGRGTESDPRPPTAAAAVDGPWPVEVARRPVGPDKDTTVQASWRPVEIGNMFMVVAPFPEVLAKSAAVLEGEVIRVSQPVMNLLEGEEYDPEKEYIQHLTYHTVTVSVTRWLMTDGTMAGKEVIITVPGGCVEEIATAEDIAELQAEGAVEPGAVICRGESVFGGLHFDAGDDVALLLSNARFQFAQGEQAAVQVSAYGVGLLEVKPDGRLTQPGLGAPMDSAPATMADLEEMVLDVTG